MKKLLSGIVDFRKNVQQSYRANFAKLAHGQSPDTLFIACSDSRVVPNTFASTDPGDLFVVRNIGNLIPPCGLHGFSTSDESEAAAIEFAVQYLNVKNVVVCGHSGCAAMSGLLKGRSQVELPHMRNWLRHGDAAIASFVAGGTLNPALPSVDQLSQLNVLQQISNLKTYPKLQSLVTQGEVVIHGWWFDLEMADVYVFDKQRNSFVLLDEQEALHQMCVLPAAKSELQEALRSRN